MSLTKITSIGDGSTTNYAIPFDALDDTHVVVKVNGAVQSSSAYSITNSVVTFNTAPATDARIVIERQTPRNQQLTQIQDASTLRGRDLNQANQQNLYIAQEGFTRADDAILIDDADGTFDAKGKRIKNVATGNDPADIATVGAMTAAIAEGDAIAANVQARVSSLETSTASRLAASTARADALEASLNQALVRLATLEGGGVVNPPDNPDPPDPVDPADPPVVVPPVAPFDGTSIPTLGWNTSRLTRWGGDWHFANAAMRALNTAENTFDDTALQYATEFAAAFSDWNPDAGELANTAFSYGLIEEARKPTVVTEVPFTILAITDTTDTAPAGDWIVEWDGDGEVELRNVRKQAGGTVNVTRSDNTYSVASTFGFADLVVTQTNASDPVRNIRLWAPGAYNVKFNPASIDTIQGAGVLRFMNWQRTNNSPVRTWAQRTHPDSLFQGTANGVAYEHQIDLAIAAGAEPWLNVPFGADDDFCTKLGELIAARVPSGTKCWVEYSNEPWNGAGAFKLGYDHIDQLAAEDTEGFNIHPRAYGKRAAQIHQLIAAQTGAEKIVRVIGGQAANSWYAQNAAQAASEVGDQRVDAIGITAYFEYGIVNDAWNNNWHVNDDKDAFFAKLTAENSKDSQWQYVTDHKAISDNHTAKLVAYEGGSHIAATSGPGAAQGSSSFVRFLRECHEDARMGVETLRAQRQWFARAGESSVHCAYTLNYLPTRFGNWGHIYSTLDDPTTYPRYQAVVAAAQEAAGIIDGPAPTPDPDSGGPATILTEADLYTRGGGNGNTNYGADQRLILKRDAEVVGGHVDRDLYLRFDLSNMNEDADTALLTMTADRPEPDGGMPNVSFFVGTNDGWNEGLVTWNNAPAHNPTAFFTGVQPYNSGVWEIDVADEINAARAASRDKITFVIKTNTTDGDRAISFHSKEADVADSSKPQLVLTYASGNVVIPDPIPPTTGDGGNVGGDTPDGLVENSDGFTSFPLHSNARRVYVSSSEGNDANDGLSEANPKRTLAAGYGVVRDGFGDHLLLKAGDEWEETFPNVTKSGLDAAHPLLVSAYGTGVRPLITGIGSAVEKYQNESFLAWTQLAFYAKTRDPRNPAYIGNGDGATGFVLRGGGSDITIEDCGISSYAGGITIEGDHGGATEHSNLRIRRNLISRCHRDRVRDNATNSGGHSSGVYIVGTDGTNVFEENVLWHNGWDEDAPRSNRTMFNHNIYCQGPNNSDSGTPDPANEAAGWSWTGNIIADGSSYGFQARSGGPIEDNFFTGNAYGLFVIDPDEAIFRRNFGEVAGVISDNPSAGGGGGFFEIWGSAIGTIEDNVALNRTVRLFPWKGAFNVEIGGGNYVDSQRPSTRTMNLTRNHVRNWNGNGFSGDFPFRDGGAAYNLSDNSSDGVNQNGIPKTFVDNTRNTEKYMASIGQQGGTDEFVQLALGRARGTWVPALTAEALSSYVRTGFQTT